MGSSLLTPLLGIDITVGLTTSSATSSALTINMDIVWATCIAGPIVITLGLILRSKATSGVPGKFQLRGRWPSAPSRPRWTTRSGPGAPTVVPLALTLFVFIFTCNLFEVAGHRLASSTSCPRRPATSTCRWPWPST